MLFWPTDASFSGFEWLPSPEGFQEAFANLYRDAAEAITAHITGRPCPALARDFPTALDGARGLRFIEAAVESAKTGTWADCRLGATRA